MKRTARVVLAVGVLASSFALSSTSLAQTSGGIPPTERGTAEPVTIRPAPLPPEGIRAPVPPRTRAIKHGPIPRKLPVPPGTSLFAEPAMAAPATPLPLSPAPSASFLALSDDGTVVPPDTMGAVSADALLVAANSQVKIQGRDGSTVSTYSLDAFFNPLSGGSGVYDPVTIYDPTSGRWIFVACDDGETADSAVLVSASTSTNPDGTWRTWRIAADSTHVLWADRPQVGFNKDWVVVQVNMFKVSDNSWTASNIYALSKADFYAGGTLHYSVWKTTSIGNSQVPTQTLDPTASTVYLVQSWDGSSAGTGLLRLDSISGAVGAESLNYIGNPSTSATWATSSPTGESGPQLGSTHKIDTGDDRILSAVYRNGSIWVTHNVFLPDGSAPNRTSSQWWQIAPNASVLQRGRIDDPTGVNSYIYPSLAVNKDSAVLLGYSNLSASIYASAAYSFRVSSDGAGTMQSPQILKAGLGPYFKDPGGSNRWGDYSSTVIDPANDTDFWTVQEYAAASSGGTDRWGMWWGKVVPSTVGPPPGGTCTPDSTSLCLLGNRFRVQVTYRNYSGGTGSGTAVGMTADTGYFWFSGASNVEVVAKMVSFCGGGSNNIGIYAGGLTDLAVTLTVTDVKTGLVRNYSNALGNPFQLVRDGPFACPI